MRPTIPFSPPSSSGIPDRCKQLPRETGTGYPVPASSFGSREEFLEAKVTGQTNYDPVGMNIFGDTAWSEGRCGVCSDQLGDDCHIVLWRSPKGSTWMEPTEPPMHEECMEYSIQVCPVLKGKVKEAKTGTSYQKDFFVARVALDAFEIEETDFHSQPRVRSTALRDIRRIHEGRIEAIAEKAQDPWTKVQLFRRSSGQCPVRVGREI